MIERESLMAQLDAAMFFEAHQDQFAATVYLHGQAPTVATLRALADLIEGREFEFIAQTFH